MTTTVGAESFFLSAGAVRLAAHAPIVAVLSDANIVRGPVRRSPSVDHSRLEAVTDSWAADWLAPALTRLIDLDEGWDGYGAAAPSSEALSVASYYLRTLGTWKRQPPPPAVMASTEGGVLLEWQTEEVDLILEFESRGEVNAHVRTESLETEGPAGDQIDRVAEAFSRLWDAT